MGIKVIGESSKAYTEKSLIINDFGDLVKKNMGLATLVYKVLARGSFASMPSVYQSVIRQDLVAEPKQKIVLQKLFDRLFQEEKKLGIDLRGPLLEHLVAITVPLNRTAHLTRTLRDCFITDGEGNRVDQRNFDFDVGTHNNFSSLEELEIELFECKVNILNYLCSHERPDVIAIEKIDKLDFMKNTLKNLCSKCSYHHVAFVTALQNTDRARSLLDCNGYNEISVYPANNILSS